MLCVFLHVQCKKYRSQFTEEKKAVYEEKLEASEIFKDKKALYPSRCCKLGAPFVPVTVWDPAV